MKVVTVASDANNLGLKQLQRSCEHFDIELVKLIGDVQWGHQQEMVYQWAKEHPNEEYIYLDGYDTFVITDIKEIENKYRQYNCKMLVSGEGVIFPNLFWGDGYDDSGSIWNYVNGGAYITNTDYFVKLCDGTSYNTVNGIYGFGELRKFNDQEWLTILALAFRRDIKIDTNCEIFQTLRRTFDAPPLVENNPDFTIDYVNKRLINNHTKSTPSIIHGNGGVPLNKIYEFIP
jgi:hypothetical protein